jgi:hypothetical protein
VRTQKTKGGEKKNFKPNQTKPNQINQTNPVIIITTVLCTDTEREREREMTAAAEWYCCNSVDYRRERCRTKMVEIDC